MRNMHNCVREMKRGTLETQSTGIMMEKRDDGWDEVTDGRSVSKHNVKSYDSRNPKKSKSQGGTRARADYSKRGDHTRTADRSALEQNTRMGGRGCSIE